MQEFISVIIVSYNCKMLLVKTVRSLVDSGLGNYEIVIVENGSDGGAKYISTVFPNVKVVINDRNLGFAVANNRGIQISTGDYILLLNPDTIVLPNTVKPMVEFMKRNQKCGICGPKILNTSLSHVTNPCTVLRPSRMLSQLFLNRFLRFKEEANKPENSCPADFVHGSCMLVRRIVIESLGGLDESLFMYCEEFEFSHRAGMAGWETWFVNEAELIHVGEGASEASLQWAIPLRWHSALKVYGRYKNNVWMFGLRTAAIFHLIMDSISLFVNLFRGRKNDHFVGSLKGLGTAFLILFLPVKVGEKIIPLPNRN